MRRLTRLTNAFSKDGELGVRRCAALHARQFCAIHQSLGVTPAMELAVAIMFGVWRK